MITPPEHIFPPHDDNNGAAMLGNLLGGFAAGCFAIGVYLACVWWFA